MGQPDGGVLHLVGVLSAQLQRSLVELAHAGRAHRMPLGEQAAAGVDGDLAAHCGAPFRGPDGALATRRDAQVLGVDHFRDGEAVVQLDEVDVLRRQARLLVAALSRLDRRVEGAEVGMAGDAGRAARLYAGRNVDARPLAAGRAIGGHQEQRCRAVAGRAAVVELERVADEGRGGDHLAGQVRAHLRERVPEAVLLVLHHHRRDLVAGGAVALRVDPPGDAEETGKGESAHAVRAVVHGAVERGGDVGRRGVGHLLHPDHQRRVALAGGDGEGGVPEGDAARCAGALHLGAGYVGETEVVAHDARQYFLSGEDAADEVAQVERADLAIVDSRVGDGGGGGLDRKHLDGLLAMLAKSRGPDSRNRDAAHHFAPAWSFWRSSVLRTFP